MPLDLVAVGTKHAHGCLHLARLQRVVIFRLIRNDNPKVTAGLRAQTGQRYGQRCRAAVGRNQNIDHWCHPFASFVFLTA